MVYVSGDISVNVYEREDGKTVPNITMNVFLKPKQIRPYITDIKISTFIIEWLS